MVSVTMAVSLLRDRGKQFDDGGWLGNQKHSRSRVLRFYVSLTAY